MASGTVLSLTNIGAIGEGEEITVDRMMAKNPSTSGVTDEFTILTFSTNDCLTELVDGSYDETVTILDAEGLNTIYDSSLTFYINKLLISPTK